MSQLSDELRALVRPTGITTIARADLFEEAAARLDHRELLLKAVLTDRGNWLHEDLNAAIEAEVGPPGEYRKLSDSGVPK